MSNVVELTLLAKDQMSGAVRGASSAIQGLVGQVVGLAGLAGAGIGLGAFVKQGVEFNKTMEDSRGGIAGVLLMTREYVDATGQVVTGQKAMDAAFAESSVIQEKLKKDALATSASYTELVGAFQTALAPAAAAGVTNLDDVREITVMATQAMAALNIPTAQAAQELRGLFSGDMGPDNRLNQILRVSKDDLKALGGDAEKTAAFFKEKLGPAASAAAMQTGTLTVRLSNLGDIVDQVMGNATSGLFKELSGLIAEVSAGVEENAGIFEDLGETVKVAFGVVKDTISDVFGTADESLENHGLTWRDFIFGASTLFVGFVESVGSGVKYIVQYLTAPIETIKGLWKTLIGGLASLLSEFLGGLADTPVIGKLFAGATEALDRFVVSLTTGDEAFDRFQKKADRNWGEGAFAAARKMMEDYGREIDRTTGKVDGLGSRAKAAGEDAAKATEAMTKAFLKAAKTQGQTWAQLVLTPLEKSLVYFATGEAAVEEFVGVLERKREVWQKAIEDIFKFHPDDTKEGAKAGLFGVFAALPTAAESAASAVQDVWAGMARAFDDTFFSVLTGKLDSLKDVFKNLWESILQTASRYFSDLLQRWLATQMQMGQPAGGSYPGVGAAGSAGKSGWGSAGAYLGAGVAGFGIGGMIGQGGAGNQWGGALGAVGGLALGSTATAVGLGVSAGMTGAMAGSVVPIIGTIVGAIIGAVIGGIFNKNTEKKFSVYTARLVDVAANDQIGRSIQDSRDNIIGMMGDLATLTGGSVKDATDQTRKVINDWLKGRRYEVHAGSQEDIDKDFERLLGEVVPSEMLKQLFGFSIKPYEPTTELPGIRGVGNFHMGNIDEGKEGPLFKMLETLGFARDRIVEIGQQIDARPAEEFIQWLNRLVGVAATSKKLFAEMGKSFADLDAEWSEKEKAGAKGAFTERATAIADAFAALENFSGDDQLKRMEEAQQGAAEFWNDVLDYVAQLREAMNQMSAGIQDQRQKMRDFLNPLGADETASNAWGEVQGVWGTLRNATDPAEVEAAVAEARSAIDKVFSVMVERINRGKALLEKLGGLGSISDELTREGIEAVDPLRAWGLEMFSMQRKVEDAARQSGLAQIQTLEEVGASAEEMYRNLKGFLADIASTSASINKSIDSQIWELGVGEMDPQGQAGAITGRIQELQEQLKIATSPAEIAAITSEIQGLTNRYVGTFGKDDPKRQEAIDWATEQLERARGLANETLDVLKAQAEAYADQLEETITTVTGLLETNISDASATIGQLSHTLGELDRVMRETMERLGDEILTTAQPIREALEEATKLFTDSIDAASGAIGGPGGGGGGGGGGRTPLVDAANLGASNLVSFAAEVAAATERLRGLKGGGSTTEQQTVVATSGQQGQRRVTPAEVVPMMRRYSVRTASRVG